MKRFTHETFEATDADGACCQLRETDLGELCDADDARDTERRLEEAAALLARVKTGDQQLASDIDQWFFRAAPQPEPTQARAEAGAKYFDWDRTPAQPAAPTPDLCRICGSTDIDHGAEHMGAVEFPDNICDTCFRTQQSYQWAVRDLLSMTKRAESAEAKLVAVPGRIETAVAQRLEAAIMSALRYEREESHSNTTRRALVIESRMDEALELLESAARIVENDDWRDRYDVLRGFIAADPEPAQKPALRPEFIALGKALCAPLAPVAPAPSPGEGEETL